MSCDESFQNVIFAFESFDWRFELECWDTYAIAFVTKTIAVHHYLWMVVTSFSIWSTKVYDKWFNYCLDDSVFWWSVFSFSHVLRTNVRSTWEKWVCPSDTNKTVEVSWSSALSLLIFRIFACLQAKSIFGAPQNFVTERHLHHFSAQTTTAVDDAAATGTPFFLALPSFDSQSAREGHVFWVDGRRKRTAFWSIDRKKTR